MTHSWQPIDPVGGRTAVRPYPIALPAKNRIGIPRGDRPADLSDHPLTQQILAQLTGSSP